MSGFTIASLVAAAAAVIGSPVAWAKLRGERTNIWINASKGAVVIQGEVIDDLRTQIEALRSEVAECREQMAEVYSLRREVAKVHAKLNATELQRDRLKLENDRLKERVEHLEAVVRGAGLDPA